MAQPSADALSARHLFRPLLSAVLLTAVYVVLCSAYIVYSSGLAEQAERLGRLKGLAFVAATGLAYFGFALKFFRWLAAYEDQLRQHQEALLAAEGRALAGVFAASTAHDMNNLLTAARGLFEEVRPALAGEEAHASQLDKALGDLAEMALRLQATGRLGRAGRVEPTDLAALVQKVVGLASAHIATRRCRLAAVAPGAIVLPADAPAVERMLMNLLLNAAEATPAGGRIEVRLAAGPPGAVLEVHDSGPGVPEELAAAIFEPFYTTKPGGSGLGLLSVKACAADHGGDVAVLRSDLGGACFRVTLRGAG